MNITIYVYCDAMLFIRFGSLISHKKLYYYKKILFILYILEDLLINVKRLLLMLLSMPGKVTKPMLGVMIT